MPGTRSWFAVDSRQSRQRGGPEPENPLQERDPAWFLIPPFGGTIWVHTRAFSRGAAAYVPNFGKVFTNPIGAGVVVPDRPQASYGPSGQYLDHQIFWAQRTIPTSIPLQGLVSPQELLDLLGTTSVQAVVRTDG